MATSFQPKATLVFLLHRLLPSIFPDNTPPAVKSQMIYLPAWSVRAKIKIKVTLTKGVRPLLEGWRPNEDFNGEPEKREVGLESKLSFFPGTSSSPLCVLSLQPTLPNLPEHLPIYDPSRHLEQYGETITALPFDSSPLVLPELVRKAKSFESLLDPSAKQVGRFVVDTEKDVRWEQFDVTPLYLPLYLAKYECKGKERTFLLEATNKNPRRCEVHFPNSNKNPVYPVSPYGRVLYNPFDLDLLRAYPLPADLDRVHARFVQPSLFDLRSVSSSQVEKDMEEDLTKELEEYLTEEWEENNLIEKFFSWKVMREGDEWLGGSNGVGRREQVRRLSLEGVELGSGRVGRIVRWAGAEGKGEEED